MAQPPKEDGFLSRWSRRKAEARAEEEAEHAPEPLAAPEPEVSQESDPLPDAITPEELAALPKVEDLVAGSDIRAFLRPGVPAALKNAALRKMWLLTPAIRDYRDPAVDYAWDWNTPGGVPGDGIGPTAERAAQMLRDLVSPQPEPEAEAETDPAEEGPQTEGAAVETASVEGGKGPISPETHSNMHEIKTDKNVVNQSDTDVPIPRRKHGGALPT